ncbi:MAG: PaaI family thioesterase [Burkholderiales bacterium]|jgi:uncharacterized protein (TIGR00369 family)|nr:PaaI family thioesterase [Burkholderiales bacterium]
MSTANAPRALNTPESRPPEPPSPPSEHWWQRMQRGELPPPPVSRLLGARIGRVDLAAGELDVTYEARPEFANPAGGVQGGMLGAMLDDLTAGLVDATLSPGQAPATVSLNLSYLRPARLAPLEGHARLLRRGREVCHVSGELLQDGKLVATAVAVCSIVQLRAG